VRRPVTPYDAEHGPAVYRGRSWPVPTRPLLSLSTEQLDAIPDYVDVREPQIFQQGTLRAVVDPRRLEYGVPVRGDILVLQLLKDNLGVRPLYVGRTSGSYAQALGLEPYALMQGLALKIASAPLEASADTFVIPGLGFLDVARTRALWSSYGAPAAILRRGDWVDRPSVSIAAAYVSTGIMLGEVLQARGDSAEASRVRRKAIELATATRTLDWFTSAPGTAPPLSRGGVSDAPLGVPVPGRR
jgi:hypothetical protein